MYHRMSEIEVEGKPFSFLIRDMLILMREKKVMLLFVLEMVHVRREEGKFEAKIIQAAYLGESIEYVLDLNGKQITAHDGSCETDII